MSKGWKGKSDNPRLMVACFENQPFDGAFTLATLGLSQREFRMASGKMIRMEIVFSAYRHFDQDSLVMFLQSFANFLSTNDLAILRGDVLGPHEPILIGTLMNSIYVSLPVVYPKRFWELNETTPETVMVWAVPIHESEAAFVRNKGWEALEDLMAEKDPDLFDLKRKPLV